MPLRFIAATIVVTTLTGYAGLDFGKQGLMYYKPTPYLFVSVNKDCTATTTAVSLSGTQKRVQFDRGHRSSDRSVSFANGIITAAGQISDVRAPETPTAIGGLTTALRNSGIGEPLKPTPIQARDRIGQLMFGIG